MRSTAMDGNSHQGLVLASDELGPISLRAGAIKRWSKYNRIHMNFLGMTGWQAVSDVHPQDGDWFLFAGLRTELSDGGYLEGFIRHQDRVMQVQGLQWKLALGQFRGRDMAFDGVLARYVNLWPANLRPDYGDVNAWRLRWSRDYGDLSYGIGWHGVTRRRLNLGAGLFFWIDPLTVDLTIPFDDRNDSQLYFVDARTRRPSGTDFLFRYGFGVNRAINVNSHEVNLIVRRALTARLDVSGFASINRYSGDTLPDYIRTGVLLSWRLL